MAARPGFEPGSREPKSRVLPLHHRAIHLPNHHHFEVVDGSGKSATIYPKTSSYWISNKKTEIIRYIEEHDLQEPTTTLFLDLYVTRGLFQIRTKLPKYSAADHDSARVSVQNCPTHRPIKRKIIDHFLVDTLYYLRT